MKQVLIAVDQLANALIGGMADETLSARLWRTQHPAHRWVDALFFWDKDHCRTSYEAEQERRHLPPEYRAKSTIV